MKKKNDQFDVENVMKWLQSKHITMWGGSGWTVTKEDTCREAADWFTGQIQEYLNWSNNGK